METGEDFDSSQALIVGFGGVGRLDQSMALLFRLAECYRKTPPESIPKISEILQAVESRGRFTLSNKDHITKDELPGLRALAAISQKFAHIIRRHCMIPTTSK